MATFTHDLIRISAVVPLVLFRAFLILAISSVIGTLFAMIMRARVPVITQLLVVYGSFFRGVPMLVQLLFWYYFLPESLAGAIKTFQPDWNANSVSPDFILIFAFVLCYSAYLAQTASAAIASVDVEQVLLGHSLGYTPLQRAVHIVFPQALRYAMPNVFNIFLSILKALSMGFVIAVVDIFAQAKIIAGTEGNYMSAYTAAALVYWVVCSVLYYALEHLNSKIQYAH